MPRDASGTYYRPPGTDAVADHTIESTRYNNNVIDVETDLNAPRPIVAGGTGANNAHDALINLHGEETGQHVTNYNTFPFVSGSFWSDGSVGIANGAPADGHGFAGICYVYGGDPENYLVLEARDVSEATAGTLYIREKQAGTWGAWRNSDQTAIDNSNLKVAKAGDTMTGQLTLSYAEPVLLFNGTLGLDTQILSQKGGALRWGLNLGNGGGEPGGNAGSAFAIARYSDAGAFLDTPMIIFRNDGRIQSNGYTPLGGGDLTNKTYVDAQITSLNTGVNAKVAKAGDTMTGDLVISKTSPQITINKAASGQASKIVGMTAGVPRWDMYLGDPAAEGGDAGSDFQINRYNDAGAYAGTPITVSRSNGNTVIGGDLAGNVVKSNVGTFLSVASGAGNPVYWLYDNTAGQRCALYWASADNTVRLLHATAATEIIIESNGVVDLGKGFHSRAGQTGAQGGFTHNFFWTGSAIQAWVDSTNTGTINVTCDYRTKKDVRPLGSVWELVKLLRPIAYTQREYTPTGAEQTLFVNDDTLRWGFIAHELQEALLPSAASGTKDGPAEIQSPDLLAIVAGLTRALQEAMARIEALEGAR